MKSKRILLVGGGGHCHSVLDSLFRLGKYDEIGIVDCEPKTQIFGVPVIGTDSDLPRLFALGWHDAAITLGSIGAPAGRRTLFQILKRIGFNLPAVLDPSALVGVTSEIGEGAFIGKRAVVNSGTQVGRCAIINTGAILEHDCSIGDFAHIAPGSTLCGETVVGENTHIGAGSVVRQQIHIGSNSLIGVGSVVVAPIGDHVKAFGNPCGVVETGWESISLRKPE